MPHQTEDAAHSETPSENRPTALSFVARDVPGHGYRCFWLRPAAGRPAEPAPPPFTIENESLSVEASTMDGSLTITDKRTGVVYRRLNRFIDGGDCGDEYNYCPPVADRLLSLPQVDGIHKDVGAARQSLEVSLTLAVPAGLTADRQGRSGETVPLSITTRATLAPGVPRLDIATWVDNRAQDHRLRVHFAAPVAVTTADYDGHFQVVRRPIGRPAHDDSWVEEPRPECPQRAFTDVSDGQVGLMVANRGLPEVEVLTTADGSTEIALTLLRCVGWLSRDDFKTRRGHAGPMLPTPGAQVPGGWSFSYSIIPHSGGWEQAYGQAYAFNAPLRAVVTSLHPGPLPAAASLVAVTPAAFLISAIKEAEDGDGWIVRGYNVGPEPIEVTLTPWRPFARAGRVNLAEELETELATAADGNVSLPVGGHGIATVRFSP
jgi:alpha-mannosidase